jgi:LPXTG-motif cell wall-anchored protein
VAVAAVVGFAVPAGANTGSVVTSQTCLRWSASVSLNNNVTAGHFVEVTSTIPGTTGIVDGHYDTTGNPGPVQIWHASGPAPSHGTVKLVILKPDRTHDFSTSASLPKVDGCGPTTTTSTSTTSTSSSTSTSTTSTTDTTQPNTATTVRETGSTAAPVTDTTVSTATVTLGLLGAPATTTTIGPTATATGSLPFTGSGTVLPVIFGMSSIAAGALLLLRKRSTC